MAADLNPDWLSCLPSSWSYGVARDGRIFFINEEAKSTTWLHPVTGEAVITGHRTTPDLPTGWEEGYTFEGARCFINHNERKVTCKHPVSGLPSQDNCIFVVNEHDRVKKERPMSTMSQASNYTGGSDYSTYPGSSPATRPSRSYKKVHNFGKRSNSIKRNPNAPAVKSNWLYKQDSTGMKLWKKRWFVLSDMCLFYYRDEKEEGILGSILLPSFHISMLSVDDHVSRKYAFKATHSNMRTYYFCTDTAKDMESWMKVMTDAALVHTEPIRRWVNPDRTKYKTLREGSKCGILRDGYPTLREVDKYGTLREGNKYGFQRDGSAERPLTKINSIKLQPAQAAAIAAAVTASRQVQVSQHMAPHQVNGSGERVGDQSPGEVVGTLGRGAGKAHDPPQNQRAQEPEKSLTRTNSMRQLENWVRTQRTQEDEDTRSITSYQTLPRNMPSHRAQIVPRYPEGYRTLPRNMLSRPESICSVAGSIYDRALAPTSNADKRRSMRDDTMWQLYEWQQRQAFSRQGPPPPPGNYGTLPSPKTMGNISEHQGVAPSIPTSPSHGSLALYHTFSPPGQHRRDNPPGSTRSEVSSPIFRGDQTMTIDSSCLSLSLSQYNYPPDRRSMPAGIPVQTITPQSLQGKTVSHVSLSDLLHLFSLSRLCEQDQVVRTQEEKLQQLHREKNTLETALLSASQEIEQSSDNPAAVQSLIQQRDVLQNGLLSTCRELARVNTELERSWREYDKMESGVSLAKTNLLEQLEALGSPQTEPPSQQHVHIQKELWRIQDVMEALAKNKPQRTTDTGFLGSKPISNLQKNEVSDRQPPRPPLPQSYGSTERPPAVPPLPSPSGARPPPHTSKHGQRNGTHSSQGPDYRLYKSEPELTTVAEEVDDNNGEDNDKDRLQAGLTTDKEPAATKGVPVYPVGIVPPRTKSPMSPPESCTIASYVTLRKGKKPDPRTERPHSAVEQTCGPGERESGRARMSVEEQLERIRRHQQASLKEKKRSSSSISPSRSPSFSKENPFVTQVTSPRGRTAVSPEEALDIDTAALVELEMEITVVEEISYRAEEVDVIPVPRLSEEEPQPQTESSNMDTEVGEGPYSHRLPESRICMADYHLIHMLMTSRSGD
uniref:Pleckstrin homology domain containing, family A member 5 n=1 Tax=Oncorhynchus kisutch TaxID=8019 RepID=A0A8C7HHM7_ONCKI